jgi:hypothetical protein
MKWKYVFELLEGPLKVVRRLNVGSARHLAVTGRVHGGKGNTAELKGGLNGRRLS